PRVDATSASRQRPAPEKAIGSKAAASSLMANQVEQESRGIEAGKFELGPDLRRQVRERGPVPLPTVGTRDIGTKFLDDRAAERVLRVIGDERKACDTAAWKLAALVRAETDHEINR